MGKLPIRGQEWQAPSIGESVKHSVVEEEQSSYNVNLLGISLAVGRLTLDQLGQVRILDPQPVRKLIAIVRTRELSAPAMLGF
jgi:hypothetical protein